MEHENLRLGRKYFDEAEEFRDTGTQKFDKTVIPLIPFSIFFMTNVSNGNTLMGDHENVRQKLFCVHYTEIAGVYP